MQRHTITSPSIRQEQRLPVRISSSERAAYLAWLDAGSPSKGTWQFNAVVEAAALIARAARR